MRTNVKMPVLLTVIACFSASSTIIEAQSPTNSTPKDPVIDRADIVHDAGLGFTPGVVRAANGELIAWWDTRGDGQPGQATQFARSRDLGKTWSKPYMTIKSDQPLTGSYSYLNPLPNGRMLCYTLEVVWPGEPDEASMDPKYLGLAEGRHFDNYYSFTEDGGHTFTKRKPLGHSVNRTDFAQGNIVQLPNGDLIWPWGYWHPEPLNGFRRSTDGGLTWSPAVRAWQDPPPGHDNPLAFNETAVTVCKDGTIVAVARVDRVLDRKFWQIKSSDNGKTWTTPQKIETAPGASLIEGAGGPTMYCTSQGQLWLAYQDAGVGPGLGLAVSDDNGDHWRFLYHLKDPTGEYEQHFAHIRYTDEDRKQQWRYEQGTAGYPNFAKISDSRVYVVFQTQAYAIPKVGAGQIAVGNLLQIPK